MARQPRFHLADGRFFHLYARGVDSMVIFRDHRDNLAFLRLLASAVERHDWSCHAFCLMNTHIHLVVEAALERVSRGMHDVLGVYAMRFNKRHARHGHLFGERFGARVIETEDSFWSTVGYVLENPVRAGLAQTYEEWPWCGAAHLAAIDARTLSAQAGR
jgi:putative transposase